MAEDDVVKKYPSLPPNYVSLAHLQQRWLQQKQQEEEERKQKQKEKEAEEQRLQQLQHQQEQEYDRKNRKISEKLNKFGKDQNFDRFGHVQRGPFEKKKGYLKEKGKARVVNNVEKGVNSSGVLNLKGVENEGCDGKFKVKGGVGGGGIVCAMVASGEEGFRGGLKRNMGDQKSEFGVFENVGEGEGVERMREDLEGEKKARGAGMVGDEEKSANGARGRQGYRKSWTKKGMVGEKVSSDFEKLALEEGRKRNGMVKVAKERISGVESEGDDRKDKYKCELRRNVDDGREKGESLENAGEREFADKKGVRLEREKEENADMALMDKDKDMKERVSCSRSRWNRDKKGRAGGKVRWDFGRERARENEPAERTVEVFCVSIGESGLQRNGDDRIVNGVVLENVMKGKGPEESGEKHLGGEIEPVGEGLVMASEGNGDDRVVNGEVLEDVMKGKRPDESEEKLGGEKEAADEGLVVAGQGNGARVRFRAGYQQNWNKKGVSRAKMGRTFEDLQLNDERNGKGRGRDMMNVGYQKYQRKSATSRMGNASDHGLMWVKKGVISDANSAGLRPSDLLLKATSDGNRLERKQGIWRGQPERL